MSKNNHPPVAVIVPPGQQLWDSIRHYAAVVLDRVKPYATTKNALLAGGAGLVLATAGLTVAFFWPRTVAFSFADNNCFSQPLVMPNLVSKNTSSAYSATPVASLSVAGYPLYSRTTCVSPIKAPTEHSIQTISFGSSLLSKNIRVSTGSFPSLASADVLDTPVSVQDPLSLKLETADRIFNYRLQVNDKSLDCTKQKDVVVCDVPKLGLAQSANYNFKLVRLFGATPAGNVFERALNTVENVHVATTSLAPGQTVYDTPSQLTLTLSRAAVTMQDPKLYILDGDKRTEVPASFALQDQTLTVKFDQPLKRSASFVFELKKVSASDGGFLPEPFALPFKTSGGPKVLGVSIGSYKVLTDSSVTVTFDSTVSATQAVKNFVGLEAAGQAVAADVAVQNNKVTINPTSSLPRCSALTVKVLDGLQNNFGISGGSAWQYKSRTICQTVFSIGSSVQGRSITAYSFGSGSSKIVFVGTTHGDEKSSAYTLNSLIDSLEASYTSIPANRTIVVIPNLNPDGYASNRRTNANNVDLNRNFPTSSWKQGVTMPDKSYNPNGGGSAPLSEPESSALASYVQAQKPRLVLTYHAKAGLVIANDAGDSDALARAYDPRSNLYYSSGGGDVFQYDTTGAFEDWLYEKLGIPALLIELWTMSSNEFSKNQNAMWYMVKLP